MYSEHLVADLMELVQGSYWTGTELDRELTRVTTSVGRILGPDLGTNPSDASLAWYASRWGTPAPPLTRAAIHVLVDGRIGFGLGTGRGVIESGGHHLVVVMNPEPGRYPQVWKLPTIHYGGLI